MNVISTWFFHEDRWSGQYAQVRGDSRTEIFRDVYRRCLLVFFSTARRTNPSAQLVLYLNQPWDGSVSEIANMVGRRLQDLGVESRVIDYLHEPPESFTRKWKNQFFVLDVLQHLADNGGASDAFVLLDSDVVWASPMGARTFWMKAETALSVLPIGEAHNTMTNGQSPSSLAHILGRKEPVQYYGGELVAGPLSVLPHLLSEAEMIFTELMDIHNYDSSVVFEEAHVLSASYQLLRTVELSDRDAKRMWTQPLKFQNVKKGDELTALWHVPAEKKYGLRRLYNLLISRNSNYLASLSDEELRSVLSKHLGVPGNTPNKWFGDISYALWSRVRDCLS